MMISGYSNGILVMITAVTKTLLIRIWNTCVKIGVMTVVMTAVMKMLSNKNMEYFCEDSIDDGSSYEDGTDVNISEAIFILLGRHNYADLLHSLRP